MNEGLKALKDFREHYFFELDEEKNLNTIEKELEAKDNLVSMCEKLAKLVGLKEKDYVELETLITKKLKAFEIIKKHILNRDMDTSGIYLEFHNGHYEPYYTIEIKNGAKQIVPIEEYDLLKEVLK